uniref:NADH-ubiquinone oxidoreductase chain 2 n=1 Tax=Tenebrionoidea sp. 15 KM-2017 TaxID=2219470 RepID=A0A346RIK4_9CUCU|nr:NADH dehydrogenase subunit 2 [Tenebrionoidea sp. 15 KM-2017]
MLFANSMILGTLITISAYSWLGMWMGLEINLLSIIPLLNSSKNATSTEASVKYFLTQALASMILLFSIIALLTIGEFIPPVFNQSLVMVMNSTLLTKLGAAPFHFWFPEVMEGLSWINCLILLTWQKIAPMILIMNNNPSFSMITVIIILSVFLGGLMSLNHTSLRKIMAFSSINHIGWMLAASSAMSIWTWYLIVYTFLNLNIVLIFYWTQSFYMKQLINSLNKKKLIKTAFMINFLSLGGLPPFIGFLPKWLVISMLIGKMQITLAIIMVIITLVSLYVYFRISMSSLVLINTESKIKWKEKTTFFSSIIMMNSVMIGIATTLFNWI